MQEIEDRKFQLLGRCTAHREENLRISRVLSEFSEKYDELSTWLANIVENFLQGNQDMGRDLPSARNFHETHKRLLDDLRKRSDEVARLDREIVPADVVNNLEDSERRDVFEKIETLKNAWDVSRKTLEARIQLAQMYVEFHRSALDLERDLDNLEADFKGSADDMDDAKMNELERRWASLQPRYVQLTKNGRKFLDESNKVGYFDAEKRNNDLFTIFPRTN